MLKGNSVNLDKLIDSFSLLEQKIAALRGKNNMLEIKLDETSRILKLAQSKENYMKEESATLQATINGLQETIQHLSYLQDENKELKKVIRAFEEKNKAKDQEHTTHVERLTMQMKAIKEDHKVEMTEAQQDMKRKLELKESELKDIIERKEGDIQELKKKLRDQEREKQSEIIKLQMEFSAKMARIQSTSVKTQQQDPSSLLQNVFKRKLQFLEEEKNREIETLRRAVREMEQQLGCTHDSHPKRRKF
ncbi:CC152 protein, partial [Atractosteus spatula]|nr:CC152 protein [Atractosteus spatula]